MPQSQYSTDEDFTPYKFGGETDDEDEFIANCRIKYKYDRDVDSEDREAAEYDSRFAKGGFNQWDPTELQTRQALNRPIITWNRYPGFCNQIQNDGRQNNPGIQVTQADGGNKEATDLRAGRIRQIEYESNSPWVYSQTRDQQITTGRAFYRVVTKYVSPTSNKQVIRIEPIMNQFGVTVDGNAYRYDRLDAERWWIETIYSREKYKREFGKNTRLASANFYDGAPISSDMTDWIRTGEDTRCVRVMEYWCKEFYPRTLCTLYDGSTVWEDLKPAHVPVKSRERREDFVICQYIIDGVGVLERNEQIGCYFPFIPVWGRIEVVEGKLVTKSAGRDAHDAQRLVNLYVSRIFEETQMQPLTPYIGFKGQFQGRELEWADINRIPRAFMEIEPVSHNGQLLPSPTRTSSEPAIQSFVLGLQSAIDAMKQSFQIYDASLGTGPVDASGVALQNRNQESDIGNYHFADNEKWSRKLLGTILLDLIPKIEAKNQYITVRDERGRTSQVPLNVKYTNKEGQEVIHKLDEGEFEPVIQDGPGYTTARMQARAALNEIVQRDPNFMSIGGDVLFRMFDFEGKDELADRYERMLPAQVQAPGDPAQLAAQLSSAQQQSQQLGQQVQALTEVINAKKVETAGKVQVTAMQEETKRQNLELQGTIAAANIQSEEGKAQLEAEVSGIQHTNEMLSDRHRAEWEAVLAHLTDMGAVQDQAQADADKVGE